MPRVSTTSSGAFDSYPRDFKGLDSLRDLFSCSEPEEQQKKTDLLNTVKNKPQLLCRPYSIGVHDWSTLPRDINRLIADKIRFIPHLQNFGLACKEWRGLTYEITKILPDKSQPPMLLLPYNERTQTSTFLEIEHSQMYDLKIPELQGKWICGSSNGWLAMVDDNMNLSLLNPLTRAQIKLPPQDPSTITGFARGSCLRDYDRTSFISRVVLSDDPSSSDCLVAIIYAYYGILGVCRLGDDKWTVEKDSFQLRGYDDVIFYQRKIITRKGNNVAALFDYNGESGLSIPTKIPRPQREARGFQLKSHLAVSCGQLLLVLRFSKRKKNKRRPLKTRRFEVYKLEADMKSWNRIHSLGQQCLFLGPNDTFILSTKEFPWCKSNCIYFTNDCPSYFWSHHGYQWDNGVYSLEENCVIGQLDIQHSLSLWPSPAIWYWPAC